MAFALIFDDTSLLLTLVITVLLALTIYLGKSYTPLVHPLILSRQSDVSPIRHKGQSALYRNANSPAGVELPSKPRRKINNVLSILTLGSDLPAWSSSKKRSFYDLQTSNADLIDKAKRFVQGVTASVGVSRLQDLGLVICVKEDTSESFTACISGCLAESASNSFQPLVIPPHLIEDGQKPRQLPSTYSSRRVHAIFTDTASLSNALQICGVDKDTVIVIAKRQEVADVKSQYLNNVIVFEDLLAASGSAASSTTAKSAENDTQGDSVQSFYWAGEAGWIAVRESTLVAAVTTHMAFFPADAQPSADDHIHVNYAAPTMRREELSSACMCICNHPAGLSLPLLALYTGAAFSTSIAAASLKESQPTLLYTSPAGATSLATALSRLSSKSVLSRPALNSKLAFLRNGTFNCSGVWDNAVFKKSRKNLGSDKVRSVMIMSEGKSISQTLLDILRSHLNCPVRQAYLPAKPLICFGNELTAGLGSYSKPQVTKYALATAPISAAHSLDLQAFEEDGRMQSTHFGPPTVASELKLVETALAKESGYSMEGLQRSPDPSGEIFVRGNLLTGTSEASQWCKTSKIGTFRPNGTLIIDEETITTTLARLGRKSGITSIGNTLTLLLCFLSLVSAAEGASLEENWPSSGSRSHLLSKRASDPYNKTLVDTAITGFLASPRASWEQGSAQSALLEYYAAPWSVFASTNGEGPPYLPQSPRNNVARLPDVLISMAYSSVRTQDSVGKLCTFVTGDETPRDGSALDPAACGEAVLLAAFQTGDILNGAVGNPNGLWARAARRQLDYLLNTAPRGRTGAISMRSTGLAYWSDGLYMMPPYLALYGLMTRNQTLLQESYNQIRRYMDELRISTGTAQGLVRHIVNGTSGSFVDGGAWLTGNGWAAAGMVKVIAAIVQSEYAGQMQSQVNDLVNWTQTILDMCYRFADPLIPNYVNDTRSFRDAAGSALIAYATYRLSSLSPGDHSNHLGAAEAIYSAVQNTLQPAGIFNDNVDVVDALTFTTPAQVSPESLAFLVMLSSAKRDHQAGNVVGLGGLRTGYQGGSSRLLVHGWTVLAVVASSILTTLALSLL